MYCPRCGAEYKEGIFKCADCHIDLVESQPAPSKAVVKSRLKNATLLALIGMIYIFLSASFNTVFPDLFRNLMAARINLFLTFLSTAAIWYFFLSFYREFAIGNNIGLKPASVSAIIAVSLSLILIIGDIFRMGDHRFNLPKPGTMDLILSLLSSALIFYFFYRFHVHVRKSGWSAMKTAALLVMVGASIGVILRGISLINFLSAGQLLWYTDHRGLLLLIVWPLQIFSSITVIYYFYRFYRIRE